MSQPEVSRADQECSPASPRVSITAMPMPPSGNALYATLKSGRRCKSKKLGAYLHEVSSWAAANHHEIRVAREMVKAMSKDHVLHVEACFFFRRRAIMTLKGQPKRNDTSNRIKALHDVLADLLHIDDCWFWSGTFDKMFLASDRCPELVNVQLSTRRI